MSADQVQQPPPNDSYTFETVEEALHSAVADLYRKERDIDQFSSETKQTEWNLAAHLAPEIVNYFKGYSYDIDVTKVNKRMRRPDIIIHKRGSENKYNLLVVEVKREGSTTDIERDAEKIRKHWFSEPLRYRFGATINLRAGNPDIRVFYNPSFA
jgi:hypothetical protein